MHSVFVMWRALVLHRLSGNSLKQVPVLESMVPNVCGTGTRKQRGLVPEPGTSGARYPSNQEPVVLVTPVTRNSGAQYPGTRNHWCSVPQDPETVVLSTSGTNGARYPGTKPVVLGTPGTRNHCCTVPQET